MRKLFRLKTFPFSALFAIPEKSKYTNYQVTESQYRWMQSMECVAPFSQID